MINEQNIVNSMLWSAYGDAIGFITELCDKNTLKYRTEGLDYIDKLIPWRRKIGGRFGSSIDLPCGCYSDDTQLRLAVCRSINKEGIFDFESFSKIELPIFLNYALGAGTGTKTAAISLIKKTIQWNTNFFETKDSNYFNGGGNGASMRIQPHVWCAVTRNTEQEIVDNIFKDTIITHGHPIAWIGSIFHGLMLKECFVSGKHPDIPEWNKIIDKVEQCLLKCFDEPLVRDLWAKNWETKSNKIIKTELQHAMDLILTDYKIIYENTTNLEGLNNSDKTVLYKKIIEKLDAINPKFRGSAIKTALLSSFISILYKDEPYNAIITCINTIGSDTDTIASMAGALLGSTYCGEPPQRVMDQEYLIDEAKRLFAINSRNGSQQFRYPDLLRWHIPKSQLDYVYHSGSDKQTYLLGLGVVKPIDDKTMKANNGIYRYYRTSFSQTVLLNHREELPDINYKEVDTPQYAHSLYKKSNPKVENMQYSLDLKSTEQDDLDSLTNRIIKEGFDEKEIGRQLLLFANRKDGIEKAIAFSSIIVKAKMARLGKSINPQLK